LEDRQVLHYDLTICSSLIPPRCAGLKSSW